MKCQFSDFSFLISNSEYLPLLYELTAALQSQKTDGIDYILDELNKKIAGFKNQRDSQTNIGSGAYCRI